MADYRGHIHGAAIGSVAYTGLVAYGVSISGAAEAFSAPDWLGYTLVTLGIGLLFGLWPDVDINSNAQKIFYRLFFGIDLILIFLKNFEAASYLGLFAILPMLGKHRGWTHTVWAMLCIPLPLVLLPYFTKVHLLYSPMIGWLFYGAALVGYASHLWMDGLFFKKRKRTSRLQTENEASFVEQLTSDVAVSPLRASKRLGGLMWDVLGLSLRATFYFFFRPFLRK
ncbi:MAG: metal-dependent hydrolase [Rhodothermia bacterium]|nr:metal-dependent hydrolase [Rhodothermia bacterium]